MSIDGVCMLSLSLIFNQVLHGFVIQTIGDLDLVRIMVDRHLFQFKFLSLHPLNQYSHS